MLYVNDMSTAKCMQGVDRNHQPGSICMTRYLLQKTVPEHDCSRLISRQISEDRHSVMGRWLSAAKGLLWEMKRVLWHGMLERPKGLRHGTDPRGNLCSGPRGIHLTCLSCFLYCSMGETVVYIHKDVEKMDFTLYVQKYTVPDKGKVTV